MSPSISIDNIADSSFANPEVFGYRLGCLSVFSLLADYWYVGLCKFGIVVRGTFLESKGASQMKGTRTSPLGFPVSHVVGVSSKPQMVGVDAGGVVAGMANMKPVRDGANEQNVCGTVSAHHYSIQPKAPVSFGSCVAQPVPATAIINSIILMELLYTRLFHTRHSMAKDVLCQNRGEK